MPTGEQSLLHSQTQNRPFNWSVVGKPYLTEVCQRIVKPLRT